MGIGTRWLSIVTCVALCAQAEAAAPQRRGTEVIPVVPRVPPPPAAAPAPASIRGSTVRLYNFLDVREAEFTPAVLKEVETQLATRLQAASVKLDVLRFKDTPTGMTFANAVGGAMIPVREVIEGERARERAASIRYRLIAFPANFEVAGAWRHYTIRWVLIDASDDRPIMTSEYSGRHMVVFKNADGAAKRGTKLVDHVVAAMHAKALI